MRGIGSEGVLKEELEMDWKKPEILEVNMSAEIGAYQDDSGERDEFPIAAPEEAPRAETA
jgi:hypothetical protein